MAFERNDNWKNHDFKTLTDFLGTRRDELKGVFDKYTGENGQLKAMDADAIKEVRDRNAELADATKRYEELREMDALFIKNREEIHKLNNEPVNMPPFLGARDADGRNGGRVVKSLGEMFVNSREYRDFLKAHAGRMQDASFGHEVKNFDLKAVMTTAAGFAPANDRTDDVVPAARAAVVIQNYIPTVNTDLDVIKYMEQTTFTNAAAGALENASLAESTLVWTERSQTVELIGTYIPVTEQQMEVPDLAASVIDTELMSMYYLKEQADILTGNGTSPNLAGFTTKAGIQTQAKGSDSVPTAAYKLLTKLRGGSGSGFVEPNLFVFHPNDWQDVRLLQDANGNYIWGSPAEPGPDRLWGKPVLQTTAITENTALAGDFALFSKLYRRRGAIVSFALVNDDHIKNRMTAKVTGRVALVIRRAGAFGTLTSI